MQKVTRIETTVVTIITETIEENTTYLHSDKPKTMDKWLNVLVDNVFHHALRHFFTSLVVNNFIPCKFIETYLSESKLEVLVSLCVGMGVSFFLEKVCETSSRIVRKLYRKFFRK